MQIRVEGCGVPSVFPEIIVTDSYLMHLPRREQSLPEAGPSDLKTLSEHTKSDYKLFLPKTRCLSKYVQIKPNYYWLQTAANIGHILASILYLTAAIGLFSRAMANTIDPSLKDSTPEIEKARMFTDVLGYFSAPFLITLISAVISQIIAFKNKREAAEFQKKVLIEYKSMKKDFLFFHRRVGTFFFICEMIEKINIQLFFQGRGTYSGRDMSTVYSFIIDISQFENNLISRLGELGCTGKYLYSPPGLDLLHIRTKLVHLLLNDDPISGQQNLFYPVLAEIRKEILKITQGVDLQTYGYDWFKRFESSFLAQNHNPLFAAGVDTVRSKNEILLYLIGEIAFERRSASEAPLLKTIDLLAFADPSSVRDALKQYWKAKKIRNPGVYHFDADLTSLARYVYSRFKTGYRDLVFG